MTSNQALQPTALLRCVFMVFDLSFGLAAGAVDELVSR